MHNKVIQNSNIKQKKEKNNSKNDVIILNPLLSNSNELSKHKSVEIYNKNSPEHIFLPNNLAQSNNPSHNTAYGNAIKHISEFSGIKKKKLKKGCVSNAQLNEIKIYNNPENSNERVINLKSDKNVTYHNESNINLNKVINIDIKKKNKEEIIIAKSDKNIIKIKKIKKNVLDFFSESDSSPEIDSIEEDNLYKENKLKISNLKTKINYNLNLNKENRNRNDNNLTKKYKRRYTTTTTGIYNIKGNKNNKSYFYKQKNEKEKKPKKKDKKEKNNTKEEEFDDVIVDDCEFNSSTNLQANNLEITNFPTLSKNPFSADSNSSNKKVNRIKSYSIHNMKNKFNQKNQEKENTHINHHIKSSTFGINNKSSITNPSTSNLSNAMEFLNNNMMNQNVNLSKKETNNTDNSNFDKEQNNKNLILLVKKGDTQKFLEFFKNVTSLPNKLVDINYKDENGYTALHYSCEEGNLKIVEILLNSNCNPNLKNNKKETPLHLASKKGFFDISKKLIEFGALLNIHDFEKNTPLHFACMNNYVDIFKYFLTNLPQADTKNIKGKTPIDLTTNDEIKELLTNYLNKNENKFKEINIKETHDSKMYNILVKYPSEERDFNKKNIQKKEKKEININNKNELKKSKIYISPSSKNIRSNIMNQKTEFIAIYEPLNRIKKKNTLSIKSSNTLNAINNSSNSLNSLNISNNKPNYINNINNSSKANTNLLFKKTELKTSKLKEKNKAHSINSKSKKKNNNNDKNKNKKQYINENNNENNCLVNELKKTRTVERFCSTDENSNLNIPNLYKNINKEYINLNKSKLNNSKIHESLNNDQNRNNLSTNRKNYVKKNTNKSINKIINMKGNNLPQNDPKYIKKNSKNKKLLLDYIEFSNKNLVNLNKTEENINKIPIKFKTKNSLKKSNINNIKNIKNNIKINETNGKIVTKPKSKVKQKKENKNEKEKNVENNLINNCNLSKISCGQNKNNIILDSVNKSNIIDKTLADNIHNKLNLNSIEEDRITPSSFVCLAQLGKGSFGEVYLVQKINTQEKYAMKVLRKERIIGQNLLKYALAERNILSLSHHPFIVKLNFAFQTATKLFLILEYCPNGDLGKHLLFEKRFSEERAKFYICEVLLALENLHKRDIIFRDLKPDNVVLDEEGHCKLTDFGLSKEGINDSKYAQSFCGSIAYLAPEMLKKQGHGKAVDWYLLGVLFYEMLIGITPFFTNRKEEIFHNIEYGELKIPDYVSKEAAELLRGLLERDPNKRLGGSIKDAQEIKEHPYFKDVDWDKVYNKEIRPPYFMNYMTKMIHVYHKPRLFVNDDLLYKTSENPNPNVLYGWSFINNEES